MIKKGDTLIEVIIAVGIFSMIAIAVTSVMSSGTSDAQTALETTLTREGIDAQAEALRFIQASYIADKDTRGNTKYPALWKKITENALDNLSDTEATNILQYSPQTCQELYNGNSNIASQKAFVLNTRRLGNFSSAEDVYVSAINNTSAELNDNKVFHPASIYPRLIYGDDQGSLINSGENTNLSRAEGIYIVAVKDHNTTKTVNATGAIRNSAFYDFYIRACWYGSNANEPSTISTVIRLHDPDVVSERPGVYLHFRPNTGASGHINSIFIPTGKSVTLPSYNSDPNNFFKYNVNDSDAWSFVGWSTNPFATSKDFESGATNVYKEGDTFTVDPNGSEKNKDVLIYAIWKVKRFWVDVNLVLNEDGKRTVLTSGDPRFKVKSYIDGIEMDDRFNGDPINNDPEIDDYYDHQYKSTTITINDHDFYQPVNYGAEVRIELYDVDGYTLNTNTLCNPINNNSSNNNCRVRRVDDKGVTEVTFTVNEILNLEDEQFNSSGQKPLNIFAEWTKNP